MKIIAILLIVLGISAADSANIFVPAAMVFAGLVMLKICEGGMKDETRNSR